MQPTTTTNNNQLNYNEPYWSPKSSKPKFSYHLEIIKDGQLLNETIPLDEHSYYLFGRNPTFTSEGGGGEGGGEGGTVQLDHPSISRHHAIIQHASNGRVYLIDLSSTHGTFWNSRVNHRLRPMRYVPLKLNDRILFGESTRSYVLRVSRPEEENVVMQLERSLYEASQVLDEQQKLKKSNEKKTNSSNSSKTRKRKMNVLLESSGNRRWGETYDENDENDGDGDDKVDLSLDPDDDDHQRHKRLRIEEQVGVVDSVFDEDDDFFDRTRSKKAKSSSSSSSGSLIEKSSEKVETLQSLTEQQQSVYGELFTLKKQQQQLELEWDKTEKDAKTAEDSEKDELEMFMSDLDKNLRSETRVQLDSMQKRIDELEKWNNDLTELIRMATPANPNMQTKDEKTAEIERDRLHKDMFFQTVARKPAPAPVQAPKDEASIQPKPSPVLRQTTEKKKPIIYGAPLDSNLNSHALTRDQSRNMEE